MDKTKLAITLSKLKKSFEHSRKYEQYPTPSEVAASILWVAQGDIKGKVVADFGCGNGIFAIGCCLLGAKKVYAIEIDKSVLEIAKENAKRLELKIDFLNKDVSEFDKKVDTIIMNPPFGSKKSPKDKFFLEKAMLSSKIIYSVHKIESDRFIQALSKDYGFEASLIMEFGFLIKNIMEYHKRDKHSVRCGCWKLVKIN